MEKCKYFFRNIDSQKNDEKYFIQIECFDVNHSNCTKILHICNIRDNLVYEEHSDNNKEMLKDIDYNQFYINPLEQCF